MEAFEVQQRTVMQMKADREEPGTGGGGGECGKNLLWSLSFYQGLIQKEVLVLK